MATFLFLAQLLFIGTLIVPAYTQAETCDLLLNATAGNFTVMVTPEAYQVNTTYLVTVSDSGNFTDGKNVSKYFLQALSPQNASIGEWKEVEKDKCNSADTAILNATQKAANWTSPDSNISSVEIRAYISFSDNSTEFKTVTLTKEPETTPKPSSVSMVQSSSFSIAVIQLPLLLVTSKLFS